MYDTVNYLNSNPRLRMIAGFNMINDDNSNDYARLMKEIHIILDGGVRRPLKARINKLLSKLETL